VTGRNVTNYTNEEWVLYTFCGDRTHDHWLKRPTLYHLS
jgi:hypothetical protein